MCVLCLVSWVVYVSSKQVTRNQRIENEISALRQEADRIRRENETLSEKVRYFASNDFREQEAKEKLGMQKAGEEVVVIRPRAGASESALTPVAVPIASTEATVPNYKKWWRMIFPSP